MDELLLQVERATDAGLHLAAVICALTVPDVAGALRAPNGIADGKRYARWFDENMGPLGYTPTFSGRDCWAFRCSLLHQGSGHPRNRERGRILMQEPRPEVKIHLASISTRQEERALVLNPQQFCEDMVSAGRIWWQQAKHDETVRSNYDRFVRYWPAGVPPFVVGTPMIG